ncbi:MAG: hypothetical protein ACI4M5_00105 [Christensenellales bacterium]
MTNNSCNEQKDSIAEKPQTLLKKLKSVKHLEIIVAFVIALVAIFIYFITTNAGLSDTTTVHTSSGGNELSRQVASVLCNVEGVGDCSVLITYDDEKDVNGVVVVAEGGDDVAVKIKIIDAVCALVDVKAEKIKIYKMNKA